jgi:hypothetical protein
MALRQSQQAPRGLQSDPTVTGESPSQVDKISARKKVKVPVSDRGLR